MLSTLLALSLLATHPTAVGPLLPRGENAPHSVCSAFVGRHKEGTHLYTAQHCLTSPHIRVWLPGLEGNALDTGTSRWSHLHSVPSGAWSAGSRGEDLARAPAPLGSPAFSSGRMPRVGDELVVWGYPGGHGPTQFQCKMAGVVVLDLPIPRLRPSLRCNPPVRSSVKGMSGGPVLNRAGEVVGVLASGTLAPEGGHLLGFEPLDASWLPDGESDHVLVAGEHDAPHRIHVRIQKGETQSYRVASASGVVWSWWPARPVTVAPASRP